MGVKNQLSICLSFVLQSWGNPVRLTGQIAVNKYINKWSFFCYGFILSRCILFLLRCILSLFIPFLCGLSFSVYCHHVWRSLVPFTVYPFFLAFIAYGFYCVWPFMGLQGRNVKSTKLLLLRSDFNRIGNACAVCLCCVCVRACVCTSCKLLCRNPYRNNS